MTVEILEGDCRDVLAQLETGSVHTVVTSPPYFGLRDYGTGEWVGGDPDHVHKATGRASDAKRWDGSLEGAGNRPRPFAAPHRTGKTGRECECGAERIDRQIGLEPTPGEFVEAIVQVFREVKRVLRDDGTAWLNLGDSYATRWGSMRPEGRGGLASEPERYRAGPAPEGFKSKDLLGIPWAVAEALRAPYYLGTIKQPDDRRWLAGVIDCEGCIFVSRSKAGTPTGRGRQYQRTQDAFQVGVSVSQRSPELLHEIARIVGHGSVRKTGDRHWEWRLQGAKAKTVVHEVYEDLIAKKQQARVALACPPSGPKATEAWEAMKVLHSGAESTVDGPAPPSLYEPGWYLRADIVWHKPNPMPESVQDRPTRSHEFVFLLTKKPAYYYDAYAIREPHSAVSLARYEYGLRSEYAKHASEINPTHGGDSAIHNTDRMGDFIDYAGRNKRDVWAIDEDSLGQYFAWLAQQDGRSDVWTVTPAQYADAHFATFPPDLIEPCVLAGAPERACGACGAPWLRQVEKARTVDGEPVSGGAWAKPTEPRRDSGDVGHGRIETIVTSAGFAPSCACDAEPVPGVVLDPFSGAGTTGLVAQRARRSYVGVELNPEYAAMSRERIATDLRIGHRPVKRGPALGSEQLDLLGA